MPTTSEMEPLTEPRAHIWGEPRTPQGEFRLFRLNYNSGNENFVSDLVWARSEEEARIFGKHYLAGVSGAWTMKVSAA